MVRLVSALVSLAVANAAFFGGAHSERQPRYRDHWVRMHPSARRSAAKVMAKREQAMEEHKRMLQMSDESKAAYASAKAKEMSTIMADKNLTEEERKRKLMTIENQYGPLYYAYGEDSSSWLINDQAMNYADIDCDWVPGWVQKLDTFPDTDWSYDPTKANAVAGADASLIGYESVCAGETTPQDPAIPNALPTVPCALICLPIQAGVSGAATQTGTYQMPAETGTKAQTVLGLDGAAAAPLVLAQDGYDTGYLGYGYAAPDPNGAGPICETFIDGCVYSTEETRTFTKDGVEMKYPRHDPIGFGDPRTPEEQAAAPDGVCSKSDSKTQWLDCGIPCPKPYPISNEELASSFGVAAIIFMVLCSILGVIALIKVGKDPLNYFVASRGLNAFVIAATLGTTSLDAGVSMGALDYGFLYHWWDGAVLPIAIAFSLIVNATFFAKPLHAMKLLTLPDLFAIKFGVANELAFCCIFFISFTALLGAQLVGSGKIIAHLFFGQSSEVPGIWICAFCVWLYTITGGLFSVVYTDVVQGLFGWTGMMVGTLYCIYNMPMAPGVSPGYPLGDKPMFFEQMANKDALDPIPNAIVFNWSTLFVLGFGCVAAPDFQARIFAAKSAKAAVWGCIFGAVITALFGCCWAFVPAAARSLYGPSSPHAEFVADSCSRHITVIGCFGPGNIETDPLVNPGCTGTGIEGCDPKIRNTPCNAIPLQVPTCGEWKPDRYGPLKMLTCWKDECNTFVDYLGDSGLPETFPGLVKNFPMPPIMGGWMILVILAASMSSGDGCILALATIFAHNVLEKVGASRKRLLAATRWSTIVWTIAAAAVASAVPDKTGYLLIVSFDICTAGALIPMFVAIYWPSCNPLAVFASFISGSMTRFILEFGLPKDSLLVMVGTFADTYAAGLYEYGDFKKFTNWDVATGAANPTDYADATGSLKDARQEVCPQRPLQDFTGVDSFISPAVSLTFLLVVHFFAPKPQHKWFQPVSHEEATGDKQLGSGGAGMDGVEFSDGKDKTAEETAVA